MCSTLKMEITSTTNILMTKGHILIIDFLNYNYVDNLK